VSLLVMRNKAEPVRSFTVAPGRFGELADALRAEPFDGSSNFDNLPIPADADMTLMVTDGLMTDGKKSINYLHMAPVMVINGAAAADTARLAPSGRPHRRRAGGRHAADRRARRTGHADARLAH
jgi:Ca-activated chloride channel family protein